MASVSHLHQSFMKDGEANYLAQITMEGQHSEHENEKGSVKLYDHPFNKVLSIADVYDVPFREQWMRDGLQTFSPGTARSGLTQDPCPRRTTSSWSSIRRPARARGALVRPSWRPDRGHRRRAIAHAVSTRAGTRSPSRSEAIATAPAYRGPGWQWDPGERGQRDPALRKDVALGLVAGGTGCDLAKSLEFPPRIPPPPRVVAAGHSAPSTWGRWRTAIS